MPKTSIRYDDSDLEHFDNLRSVLHVGTNNKAFLKAARELPRALKELAQVKMDLMKLEREYDDLVNLLAQKTALDERLNELVCSADTL